MALPEESARFRRQRSDLAVSLAMQSKWDEAVSANQSILRVFPSDVDAYNRLGKAHAELGQYEEAREAYSKALELEPTNIIAKKNITRLAGLKEVPRGGEGAGARVDPRLFIAETGKTTVLSLQALGKREVLAKVTAGEQVVLKVEDKQLHVTTLDEEYIGLVEPRVGMRLVKLMSGGNRYEAAITSASDHQVKVIIREAYQAPELVGRLSFLSRSEPGIRPYIKGRLVRYDGETAEGYSEEGEEDEESSDWEEDESSGDSGFIAQSLPTEEDSDDEDEEEI